MPITKAPRSLRILIHGLNFSPDMVGISKYTAEMTNWLAVRGHNVRVVTAPPYYPAWRISPGYSGARYAVEQNGAVRILRCPLWVPRNPTGVRRILHLASFAMSSLPALIFEALRFRPDIIWAVQPALLAAPATQIAAKLTGARSWMHVQDLEIDAAFQLGLLSSARVRRAALALHQAILRRFDWISSISPRMCEKLIEQGAAPSRISLFWNWVDTNSIAPDDAAGMAFRQSVGIPMGVPVALYSGSMGNKQGLSIIIDAARRLDGKTPGLPRVHFVLCGEGTYRPTMESLASDLDNIMFLPLQPAERFNAVLSMSDIHLLPQRANAEDLVLPSKLGGMMASARPVVATAHPDTTLAQVVAPCGIVVPPEDPDAFTSAIAALAVDPARRRMLGDLGRQTAQREWSTDEVLGAFERELLALAGA